MRVRSSSPPPVVYLSSLLLAACAGGDLLLPSSGEPTVLRLVSGDLQEAEAGAPLPDPLVVAVEDAAGRPVPGSRIFFRFELASDGGRVSPDTVQTDSVGQATATVRLGDHPGAHPVEAAVVDATGLRVRFILTALAPEPQNPDNGGGGGGPVDGGGGGDDDGGGRGHGGKGKGNGHGHGGHDED